MQTNHLLKGSAMKKKLFLALIILVLIIGSLLYFRPLNLSDLTAEDQSVIISYQQIQIKNGSPRIYNTNYNEITENEKEKVMGLLKQSSCQRTFRTFFSNSSLAEMSSESVNIYLYDESSKLVNTIIVTDSDQISVSGKSYRLKNSSTFIDKLIEVF